MHNPSSPSLVAWAIRIFCLMAVLISGLTQLDAHAEIHAASTHRPGISTIAHSKPVPGAVLRDYEPPAQRWEPGHRGVDLAATPGTPVAASAAGVVHFSGAIDGMTSVSIMHADGIRTTYQPLESLVRPGQEVTRGQIIGTLSSHPRHPEPGLHWGALRGRDYLNPLDLLRRREIVLKPVR